MIRKIAALIVIISMWVLTIKLAYAGQWSSDATVPKVLGSILKFLSWFWIVPAIIAWKLMTNAWVWWETINLDKYLYVLWQMMKNFANYFLVFFFLWMILYSFFKWKPTDVLRQTIPKLLIATVLIQASRWIIGALVDLSNVLTMTVWSISYQIIKEKNIKIEIPENTTIDLSQVHSKIEEVVQSSGKPKEISISIIPNANSVSGPLVYFWASVLKLFNMSYSQKDIDLKTISTKTLLGLILVFMFAVPLIVLAIVNFVRIFWIWMFIIFSPFMFIDLVFNGFLSKKVEWLKKLSFSNLIWLIFMPVAVVWMLSVGLIFTATMSQILSGEDKKQFEKFEKQISSNFDSDSQNIIIKTPSAEIVIDKNILPIKEKVSKWILWTFWYLILFLFIIFFLWTLLPLGFRVSELTASISDSIFKFAKDMAMVTPIPGIGMSPAVLQKWLSKAIMKTDLFSKVQAAQSKKIVDFVNQLSWVYKWKLSPIEINELKEAMAEWNNIGKVQKFANALQKIAKWKASYWSMQSDPELKSIVKQWLKSLDDKTLWAMGLTHLFKDLSKKELRDDWYKDTRLWGILRYMAKNGAKGITDESSIKRNLATQYWAPAETQSLWQSRE